MSSFDEMSLSKLCYDIDGRDMSGHDVHIINDILAYPRVKQLKMRSVSREDALEMEKKGGFNPGLVKDALPNSAILAVFLTDDKNRRVNRIAFGRVLVRHSQQRLHHGHLPTVVPTINDHIREMFINSCMPEDEEARMAVLFLHYEGSWFAAETDPPAVAVYPMGRGDEASQPGAGLQNKLDYSTQMIER